MSKYTVNFVDLFDWELESDRHLMKMLEGPEFQDFSDVQEPASIEHKIEEDDNQTNKRALRGVNKKRFQP